jgi:hypothetical protein
MWSVSGLAGCTEMLPFVAKILPNPANSQRV